MLKVIITAIVLSIMLIAALLGHDDWESKQSGQNNPRDH